MFNRLIRYGRARIVGTPDYRFVILVFGIGAALGSLMTSLFKERTIWISCGFLFVCFCIMFMKEDIEGEGGLD